jgi:hypothetical protein
MSVSSGHVQNLKSVLSRVNRNEDTPTIPLSRKRCLTLEMIRKLDRQLKIPVDKRRPTLPTLIAALFYDLSTDKEIKISSIGEKRERELRSEVIVIAIDYS